MLARSEPRHLPCADGPHAGRQRDAPAARHGVARIDCQVDDGKFELVGIDPGRRKLSG